MRLWDAESGYPVGKPMEGHRGSVRSVAFSPDGRRIVSGGDDHTVRLWDAESGKAIGEPMEGHRGPVLSVAFNPDGTLIVSGGSDRTVRLWDAESGKAIGKPLEGHRGSVLGVAFSPDGTRIVSGGSDRTVQLWYAESGKAIGEPMEGHDGSVRSVAFSQDGTRIVSSGSDGTMRLWDAVDGNPVGKPMEGHRGSVLGVAFSPDGTRIVSSGSDRTVRLWDAESGKAIGEPMEGHRGWVLGVAFSPDGRRIVSGSDDRTVRLWDAESGKAIGEPMEGHRGQVLSVAFGPDGKRIVSGGRDRTVRLWNAESGKAIGEPMEGHDGPVRSVAFSPDGRRIVSGGRDRTVRLWNAEDGKAIGKPMEGHRGPVLSVALSPDGKRIVSGGDDRTVRLWDVAGRRAVGSRPTCPVENVIWPAHNAIFVNCHNRFFVFSANLDLQGKIFLLAEGLVAIAAGRGVYASPRSIKDRVLAFRGTENLGAPQLDSMSVIRQTLFDKWSVWSRLQDIVALCFGWIKDTHGKLHALAYVVWLLLIWVLIVLSVITMWLCFPSRLAWLSMPKAGRRARFPGNLFPHKYLIFIVPLRWFAASRRPLQKWLQKYRNILEYECFTGRNPVIERDRFWPVNEHKDAADGFDKKINGNERGLVWIDGVGGGGKSALAMYLMRETLIGKPAAPLPIFIGEDWTGSLSAQVAKQLRHADWRRGPTEAMVKTLGANGLICPLVDSLSERSMEDAVGSVKNAISNHDFRHLIVTSRNKPPDAQIWQAMARLTPGPLGRGEARSFIQVYVSDSETDAVEKRIASFLDDTDMPSPLFLRFAIEQAVRGPLEAVDRLSLVLAYVEALRSEKIDIDNEDMKRAAAIAAITSVQNHLNPREFSEQQFRQALTTESNAVSFHNAAGDNEIMVARIVEMLVRSGLIVRGIETSRLQFAYDPVAAYLAAWWVKEVPIGALDAFRERIEHSEATEVGRAYRKISDAV